METGGVPDRDRDLARHWSLDPAVTFLNHGSFGACPLPVLAAQQALRARLESEPVRFFVRELEGLLDAARAELAAFVGADPRDMVWVANATTGVNTVLRALPLASGDEILVTDHAYAACRNALERVARRRGAALAVAQVPFPIDGPEAALSAILDRVTPRTRLALVDHVTSPTGLVLPIERIVRELASRGVDALVDGAHAPGMLPLDLDALGAAYYTGNAHKWLCAPKGAAFLHVRRDRHERVAPLVVSHGAGATRTDRSRLWLEFDWTGTDDPTAALAVPAALRFLGTLYPGGWPELRRRNRDLALYGRRVVAQALGLAPPCPESMIGSLAALPLPDGRFPAPEPGAAGLDPLQDLLFLRHAIEVPVYPWPQAPRRLLRLAAQAYNTPAQYDALAAVLSR